MNIREKIQNNNKNRLPVHRCGICNYKCGFIIRGDDVYYDNGCHCTDFRYDLQERNWEDIENHISMQTDEVKQRILKEWGIGEQ